MTDSQTLMNGFMRMAVDNAVLSGNLVFEIDETNLVPDKTYRYIPAKYLEDKVEHPVKLCSELNTLTSAKKI